MVLNVVQADQDESVQPGNQVADRRVIGVIDIGEVRAKEDRKQARKTLVKARRETGVR